MRPRIIKGDKLIFAEEHIEMILKGTKTATRRFWKRWMVKEGGTYAVQSYRGQPRIECPIILVKRRYMQRLGDMTESDAKKEGGYSLKGFKKRFHEFTKHWWNDDLIPHVVEFKLHCKPTKLTDFYQHERK